MRATARANEHRTLGSRDISWSHGWRPRLCLGRGEARALVGEFSEWFFLAWESESRRSSPVLSVRCQSWSSSLLPRNPRNPSVIVATLGFRRRETAWNSLALARHPKARTQRK